MGMFYYRRMKCAGRDVRYPASHRAREERARFVHNYCKVSKNVRFTHPHGAVSRAERTPEGCEVIYLRIGVEVACSR